MQTLKGKSDVTYCCKEVQKETEPNESQTPVLTSRAIHVRDDSRKKKSERAE